MTLAEREGFEPSIRVDPVYPAFPGPRKGWCSGGQAGILNSPGGATGRSRAGLGSPRWDSIGPRGQGQSPPWSRRLRGAPAHLQRLLGRQPAPQAATPNPGHPATSAAFRAAPAPLNRPRVAGRARGDHWSSDSHWAERVDCAGGRVSSPTVPMTTTGPAALAGFHVWRSSAGAAWPAFRARRVERLAEGRRYAGARPADHAGEHVLDDVRLSSVIVVSRSAVPVVSVNSASTTIPLRFSISTCSWGSGCSALTPRLPCWRPRCC